ncbi:MAG TPA: hypothetical protein VGG12_04510 [Methylovirgula sp.]|jgi:hypothetical protein
MSMKVFYALGFAASVLVAATPALAGPTGQKMVTCKNTSSGVSWQIAIDYDKGTVDSNSAQIGTDQISWHDPKDNGNYSLDTTTGKLTVILGSSTGGYFVWDQCDVKN